MILRPTTPEVFEPLWTQRARYKAARGGRGSGKSRDRALHTIVKMVAEGARVACLREVQNSIKDSVHMLLADTIQRENVGASFEVLEHEIRGPNGALCVFRGMKDQNAETVKSMEGFDVFWWEEAQAATQRSLDVLRPTLRKPGSELWFTLNPRFPTDPVEEFMLSHRHEPNFVVVDANYSDNPFFPAVLEEERLLDQRGDPDRYAHIWLGAYEAEGDDQLIPGRLVRAAMQAQGTEGSHISDPKVGGLDVARHGDDSSTLRIRRGLDGRSYNRFRWPYTPDLMQLASMAAEVYRAEALDALFVDVTGMGYGVHDRLQQLGIPVIGVNFGSKSDFTTLGVPKAANKRAEIWLAVRAWLQNGGILAQNDKLLERDLMAPRYRYDAQGGILLESKEEMKKRGVPSSDEGDGFALTFAYPVQPRTVEQIRADEKADAYDPIWRE